MHPSQTSQAGIEITWPFYSTDPMKSWSCVPNNYTIPTLAPAYDENVCPHWAERWELRTRPLGCQVSTITSLTSIVSIVSTLVVVLVIALLVLALRRLRRYHQQQEPGWWRLWKHGWRSKLAQLRFWGRGEGSRLAEQEPLLQQ